MSKEETKAVATANPRNDALVGPAKAPSVIARLADKFGVDQNKMMDCLKATAFKGGCTNEQLMALCIVAEQYNLNPWTREIYAFPDKNNGIVPVVGVDGWARIINEHPMFDGLEFTQDDEQCTCTIFRKDRSHPISTTEYAVECKRNTQPWGSHPKRMLRHKTLIQTARLAFGFVGIFDQDEAERILEAKSVQGSSAAPYKKNVSPLARVELPAAETQINETTAPAAEDAPPFNAEPEDAQAAEVESVM